jgi:hypothetical protein
MANPSSVRTLLGSLMVCGTAHASPVVPCEAPAPLARAAITRGEASFRGLGGSPTVLSSSAIDISADGSVTVGLWRERGVGRDRGGPVRSRAAAPGMSFAWYDLVGVLGTLMILAAFFLLQAGRMAGDGAAYQLLNLFGAAAVLVTLLGTFNVSVFVLESAWVLVSLYGLIRARRSRRGSPPPRG